MGDTDAGAQGPLRGRLDEPQSLLGLSRQIMASLDLDDVLDATLGALRRLIDFGGGSIQLVDEGMLQVAATDPPAPEPPASVAVDSGVAGWIAGACEPFYSPDVRSDPEVAARGGFTSLRDDVVSYFGAPLELHGRCIGVLQIDSPKSNGFTPEHQARVLACAPIISAAVHNALTFRTEHEELTRLREVEQGKRDFVTIVSHELRTPLAVIMGFASAIADNASTLEPARVADLSRRIIDSGRRLDRLIGDLLDLSRIERGAFRVEVGPVSISRLFDSAGLIASDLEVHVEDDLPPALCDEDRLHQIMDNLVGNAKKFSPPAKTIEISARRSGPDTITISVTDQGSGIPDEVRAQVFEPFFQADPKGGGGVGLGLFLVREITAAMGGHVEIDSRPGRGTTVAVTLPVAVDPAAP